MQRFKNILVGVDLRQGDRFVGSALSPPCVEAIERATWLAKMNSARLTFAFVLDVSAAAQRLIAESDTEAGTLVEESKAVLSRMVHDAANAGISADIDVRIGKSWVELIRRVVSNRHDLVVAGTRHMPRLKGMLLGSTGIKLLRKCPCPVWITQPQSHRRIQSIVVAHCLRPVGDMALELGCSMAKLQESELHIVHAIDERELRAAASTKATPDVLSRCRSHAQQHVQAQLANYTFSRAPQIHIVDTSADDAILTQIDQFDAELLVMGTIARTGIPGLFTGNTAERLLPLLPCSLLAVKPLGFVSPVG